MYSVVKLLHRIAPHRIVIMSQRNDPLQRVMACMFNGNQASTEQPYLEYRVFQLTKEAEYERMLENITKGNPAVVKFVMAAEELHDIPERLCDLARERKIPCDMVSLELDVPIDTSFKPFRRIEHIRSFYHHK